MRTPRLRVVALEEPAGIPADEKTEEFVAAFEHAKVADVDYQNPDRGADRNRPR